jgi:phospholipase/carboxylesterase
MQRSTFAGACGSHVQVVRRIALLAAALTLTPASGAVAGGGAEERVRDAASELDYRMFTTADADPDAALPLLVVLHGRGETGAGWMRRMKDLRVPARVVVPSGPIAVKRGRRGWFRPNARANPAAFADAVAEVSDRVATFVGAIAAAEPTCGRPLVVGYSQGGIVALTLALRHPEALDEAMAIAGTIPSDLVPRDWRPHARLRDLHGTTDRRVAYDRTRQTLDDLSALGYDVRLQSYPGVAHAPTAEVHDDLARLVEAQLERLAADCP